MTIFKLPDLGEGLPDAEIHEWHVKEDDTIKLDEPMVSMETAKAVVDVPAPQSGRINKLYGQSGDIIKTGDPLVEFSEVNVSDNDSDHDRSGNAATVAGTIEVGDIVIAESATGITPTKNAEAGIKATPAVRALAKKLGVDLHGITGTGPNNQLTAQDVEKAASPKGTSAASDSPTGIKEPLRGVRRAMAQSMVQSHQYIVPVTIVDDADLHLWLENTDITVRILRSIVKACGVVPALNAHFHNDEFAREIHSTINIGIAMDSKDGLFVPVLKDAANQSPQQWRETINRFKEQVKDRSIPQADLHGFTIILSNFGSIAGRYASPVIVPPAVAILGTGKIREEVIAHQQQIAIHRVLPLSITIDHCAVTGGEAGRFLGAMIDDLQLAE